MNTGGKAEIVLQSAPLTALNSNYMFHEELLESASNLRADRFVWEVMSLTCDRLKLTSTKWRLC